MRKSCDSLVPILCTAINECDVIKNKFILPDRNVCTWLGQRNFHYPVCLQDKQTLPPCLSADSFLETDKLICSSESSELCSIISPLFKSPSKEL